MRDPSLARSELRRATGGRPQSLPIFEASPMLETIVIILLVLWFLGIVSSHAIGGMIHLLLVLAIIVVLVRVIQGRRVV
jgi:hypothetical protein